MKTATGQTMRPILRYHGGKFMLAPWIISHFPEHRIYVEPYGGAASILIRKEPSYAEIYNELDPEIVNVFRVMRDKGGTLQRDLKLTPFARAEFEQAYEAVKDGDYADPDLERARRTIIKSFMGFGSDAIKNPSGFRANSHRSGTTPAHDWANYADAADFLKERLRKVVIENRDAIDVILQHDSPDTLFYVDPPYVHSTRTGAKQYQHEMSDEDHQKLAAILHGVMGTVILSGYPSALYDALYADWRRIERRALADGARERTEVLWINREERSTMGI